ncbi:MAG: hypothetical protein L7F78_11710, partial [Syntrophales bacterium LBB04]|nr:hypothetical protein [Syntrophales bacterium LBB04]
IGGSVGVAIMATVLTRSVQVHQVVVNNRGLGILGNATIHGQWMFTMTAKINSLCCNPRFSHPPG